MRKIQLIIIIMLIVLGFTISNEFYIDYISNFSDLIRLNISANEEYSKENVLTLEEYANNDNVSLCIIVKEVDSKYSSKIKIFCSENLQKCLESDKCLISGIHRGLVSGSVSVEYESIENISDSYFEKNVEKPEVYMYGADEDIEKYQNEIEKLCEVSYSGENNDYLQKQGEKSVLLIWIIISAIVIILSYFVMQSEKKENVIRISLGENAKLLVLKNIIFETMVIVASFECFRFVLGKYQYTDFNIDNVRKVLVVVIAASVIFNIGILFFDISKVMSNAVISTDLVLMNYGLKLFSTVVIGILIIGSMSSVKEYRNYKKLETYYSYFKDCNYVDIKARNRDVITITGNYSEMLYRNNVDDKKLVYFVDGTEDETGTQMILANRYAIGYIKSCIKELEDFDFEEKIYIIYNSGIEITDEILTEARFNANLLYCGDSTTEIEHIKYKKKTDISFLSYGTESNAVMSDDFIIILNNMSDETGYDLAENPRYGIFYDAVFWPCSEDEIAKEVSKIDSDNQINAEVTNAYDTYLDKSIVLYRLAMFKIAIIAALMIIFTIVTKLLVKVLYASDGIEIAIKKTLGYSMLARYKKIYIISFLFDVFSIVFMKYYVSRNKTFGINITTNDILIAILAMLLLDFVVVSISVYRQEKINTIKTLKGGCL